MKKNIAITLLAGIFLLGACSQSPEEAGSSGEVIQVEVQDEEAESDEEHESTESETESEEVRRGLAALDDIFTRFPREFVNDQEAIEGGVLRYGVVSDSGFRGLFTHGFAAAIVDITVANFINGIDGFLSLNEDLIFSQNGLATFEFDIEANTFTLRQQHEATWHDGNPVTLDDLVFAYEVIAHPDYVGTRFSNATGIPNVVGVEEFRNGTADYISGLVLSDDRMTLTIHYNQISPSMLYNGIWAHPLPRHYLGEIAVIDMPSSPQIRQNPIGFGPFKVSNIVPGESVELVRFEDYWKGAPKLDGVILEIVSSELVPLVMEEGLLDIVFFPVSAFEHNPNPTNFTFVADLENSYSYIGFRFGTLDRENRQMIPNENATMNDANLRRAIGYAIDNQAIADTIYNGLRIPATSIVTPFHRSFLNEDLQGFYYNPELANQILDEAGYTERDAEGYRMKPNGEPLTITWGVMNGDNAEVLSMYKIQKWREVGLRVELLHGRFHDSTALVDMIANDTDDFEIDMFSANWNLGNNPNPAGHWGNGAVLNYTRYTSDRFEEILAQIGSEAAWDRALLAELFNDWQDAFFEEVPAIPTMWRITMMAVNNRVKNYSLIRRDGRQEVSAWAMHLWQLTDAVPHSARD